MGFNHRRKSRILVCQALYQWLMTGQSAKQVEAQYVEDNQDRKYDKEYFLSSLKGVFNHIEEIDGLVQGVLSNKLVAEVTPVELSICRLGVYELMFMHDVPYKVVISEALHIEKRFGTEEGYKFVNGVLDAIAKQLRPKEMVVK